MRPEEITSFALELPRHHVADHLHKRDQGAGEVTGANLPPL
jgi:hypothetical protein